MSVCVPPLPEVAHRSLTGVSALLGKVEFCAPTATLLPLAAAITVGSRTGEGNRAISSRVCPATRGKKGIDKAFASAGVLYIFQLAAMSALRAFFRTLCVILVDGIDEWG